MPSTGSPFCLLYLKCPSPLPLLRTSISKTVRLGEVIKFCFCFVFNFTSFLPFSSSILVPASTYLVWDSSQTNGLPAVHHWEEASDLLLILTILFFFFFCVLFSSDSCLQYNYYIRKKNSAQSLLHHCFTHLHRHP